MPQWLFPFCAFFILIAGLLGGTHVEVQGGSGPRHVLALLLTLAAYMILWFAVRAVLVQPVGAALATILALFASAITLPLMARLAFRAVGARITGRLSAV